MKVVLNQINASESELRAKDTWLSRLQAEIFKWQLLMEVLQSHESEKLDRDSHLLLALIAPAFRRARAQ